MVYTNFIDCYQNSVAWLELAVSVALPTSSESLFPSFQVIQEHHMFFAFVELVNSTSKGLSIIVIHQNMAS